MRLLLINMSFFAKTSVTLDVKNDLVHLSGTTMLVRWKCNNKYMSSFLVLPRVRNTTFPPSLQVMTPIVVDATCATANGTIHTTPALRRNKALLVILHQSTKLKCFSRRTIQMSGSKISASCFMKQQKQTKNDATSHRRLTNIHDPSKTQSNW